MTGGYRWFPVMILLALSATLAVWAQGAAPPRATTAASPAAVTEDAKRLVELGLIYMGQNNPKYALKRVDLEFDARNQAGAQARRIFQQATTLYPKYAEGWLWLGIALTETLHYSKQYPQGEPERTEADVAEALRAFRTAYETAPEDLLNVTFYAESLMVYRKDFDGARQCWEQFLRLAKTDMQRVTALTQVARACINKGYFGRYSKKLTLLETKQLYVEAERLVGEAAKICPNAPDVKAMQELLLQQRDNLCGK